MILPSPSERSSADQGAARDDQLRLARRVDWRFLLGSPALGSVVLAGDPGPSLREALATFARSVRVIGDTVTDTASGAADLVDVAVVAGDLRVETLGACVAALRPGGWLVAEAPGLLGWRPGRPLRSRVRGARLVHRLDALGFDRVTAYLAWPDHEATTAYVPLQDPVALSAWLARRVDERAWRIVARVASRVARTAMPAALVPALTVVARLGITGETATARSVSWHAARLHEAIHGETDSGHEPSVIVLTPRFRASGHVVAMADLSVAPGGGPRAVLKASRLQQDVASIEHEADALRRVAPTLGSMGLAPVLRAVGNDAGSPFLVESGVNGSALDPRAVRRDRDQAARGVAAFVARMPVGDGGDRPYARLVGPALELLRDRCRGHGIGDLVAGAERIAGPALDADLPSAFEHGDLAHPNLVRTADGSIGAVDWERAEARGLPLHDLVIGLAYIAAADRGAQLPDAQAVAFRASLAGPDAWLSHLIDAELTRLSIDPSLRTALLLAPWLRTAAWLAERTDPARWLADRSVAHWRAMLHGPEGRS